MRIALLFVLALAIAFASSARADTPLDSLTPLQRKVTQEGATEPPFKNAYWNNKEAGIYVDLFSGAPLFSSLDKYDSGTGWPSFTRPIDPKSVKLVEDRSLFEVRTEVRSSKADSHLGHVFDDGPPPTRKRYCMNSAALRFVPVDDLANEGYAEFLPTFGRTTTVATATAKRETALLAGGCFWGMEDLLRAQPGVISTEVGYTGGSTSKPGYTDVHAGRGGHAEAVQVVFDPAVTSYEEILVFFFRMHDPTTLNRQGNDVGVSYRSAIFYESEAQKQTAEAVRARVNASGKWKSPLVTEIAPAGLFWPAESEHQDYLIKNPGGYTCHYVRELEF